MTADRTWMEKLGFELEDKGSMVPLWVVVDDCGGERPASLAEIVLWTSLTAPQATVAPELDVTEFLLNLVPGYQGEGLEIYAKSVDDVVALLTKQGERIEELESRPSAPVAPAVSHAEWSELAYTKALVAQVKDLSGKLAAYTQGAPVAPAEPLTDEKIQDLYEAHTGRHITSEAGFAQIVGFAREVMAQAAPVAPALERMRHIANEWADMATSGHQWLRNIIAGVSTPADALANSTLALQHCRKVNDAPATPPDTRKPCTCDGAGRGPGREGVVQACGRLGELWRCVKGNDGVKP